VKLTAAMNGPGLPRAAGLTAFAFRDEDSNDHQLT
jgi:hypothetical protein